MNPPKNKNPPENKKKPTSVYRVHEESFEGKPALVVSHTRRGQCPLLGLSNLLLLRKGGTALDTLKSTDGSRYMNPKRLQTFVHDRLVSVLSERVEAGIMSHQERERRMMKYGPQLDELCREMMLLPILRSIDEFTSDIDVSKRLFQPLAVTLRHALVPDPKDTQYSAIKDECTFRLTLEFIDYEEGCKKGEQYAQSYHDKMSVVKQLLIDGPSFTSYGFGLLRKEAIEKELFLLHANTDLHVIYKKDGELYLLAIKEDMRAKYPDIMWLGLDENFDFGNPLETARRLTNTFSPVNENWNSASNQFLEELEEEKRRPKREIETAASPEEAQTTCLQTKVDTDDSQVETVQDSCDSQKAVEMKRSETTCLQTKVDTDDSQVETVQDSCDSQKAVEMKGSETVVELRFLRFMCRHVVSFKEFTSSYVMYKIYHFEGQKFSSTSHLGRLMAKGFLVVIFDVHKSGYSWNGDFKKEDMFLELELVDGGIGAINCIITLTPNKDFKKKHGEADLETFVRILFPCYLCEGFQELPCYFQIFEADIKDMPNCDDPPEKFKKFHKYMSDHFFAKAPLVRSTLVSSVYGLCDSEIVHADQSKPKPRYGPLDVNLPHACEFSFSELLKNIYVGSRVEIHVAESMWTSWDAIELGRHSKQHMMQKMQEKGLQQVQDPGIIDLIVEHDLQGLLTQPIKLLIQRNNFEGRFESIWEQFSGSEPKDDGSRIPLLLQAEEVEGGRRTRSNSHTGCSNNCKNRSSFYTGARKFCGRRRFQPSSQCFGVMPVVL